MPERGTQTIAIPDNATGSRFFDRFPKEIRNEIYQLAYAPDRTGVVEINTLSGVVGSEWDRRNGGVWGQPNATGPFMSIDQLMRPFVPQLLVNKQFYKEALEEYFRKLGLDSSFLNIAVKKSRTIWQNLNTLHLTWTRATLIDYPSDADLDGWGGNYGGSTFFQGLDGFKRLEKIQLTVSENIFRSFYDRIPCLHKYSDQDFGRISDLKVLSRVSSLKTVMLVPVPSQLAKNQPEHDTLAENFAALQSYIDRQIESKNKKIEDDSEQASEVDVPSLVDADGDSDDQGWGGGGGGWDDMPLWQTISPARTPSRPRTPSLVLGAQASGVANETQPCDMPWRPWLSELLNQHRTLLLCVVAAFTLALLLYLLAFVILLALLVLKMAV